ncbi:MAG: hypothetical protein IJ250_07540 [Bacteroidales bacterium]|nr:hypothetical protein [Bacteroidales bacterium]MBQ7985469.1 hypothetical protein [Bacteroidales bacterium]
MNKLNISKLLDTLALIAIVIVFALYIFKILTFNYISLSLVLIAILKMAASMLKSSYYAERCNTLSKENEYLNEQVKYLQNESNKQNQ